MNTTALKSFYIILGASLTLLGTTEAAAQAGLGPVQRTIDRSLEQRLPRLEDRLDGELQKRTEETREAAGDALPPVDLELPEAVPATAAAISDTVDASVQSLTGLARAFVSDVDPFGYPIEKNTLVVLVTAQDLAGLRNSGLSVISEREMPGIGLTLVTLQSTQAYSLAEQALELREAFPAATVDFNHLYRFQQEAQADDRDREEPAPADGANGADAALRIGLIDSAVAPEHPSLRHITVQAHDFVTHAAKRPPGHGTAVASVLAAASDSPLTILSASVFFQADGHAPGATTESLLLALDWLATKDVDAINMSLAGPANELLERALLSLAARGGPAVVAAVGNNGPSGEPLYPGAYESVIGVTAVDRDRKIFRYANRGDHVDFAALGVGVKVAQAGGSWRLESGTSMAAPRVAVVAGRLHREQAVTGTALRALLVSNARDLGRPGFDPVFGYGLLTQPPAVVSRSEN